jgi:branched-chain amino acid transport system substrate-binding protein
MGLAGCVGGIGGGGNPDTVVIGSMNPLSGPFAFDGQLNQSGIEFAVEEINEAGGVEALDGATLEIASVDTGETADSASTAAQDLYSNNNPSASIGSWLSSQTLATTAVSEREAVPQLTLSFSDAIVDRGFKYVFKTAALSSEFGNQALAQSLSMSEAVGDTVSKIAMVGDNTAAIEFTFNPLREETIPNEEGVELVVDEVWTPTLSDATPIVRSLQQEEPDVMFFGATAFPDSIAILRKMNELGVQLPTIGIGAWLALPPYIENVGVDLTKGLIPITASHPLKGQEETVQNFIEFSGQPFMVQDSISSYGHVYLIKEAIERAESADPQDVRDTLASETFTEGPAVESFPVEQVKFMENGLLQNVDVVTTQWQDRGDASYIETEIAPFAVFPEQYAVREVSWTPASY